MGELFSSFDVQCMVGHIEIPWTGDKLPIFLADYGDNKPSLFEMMLRYRKVSLDIVPVSADRFTYVVTGDKIIAEFDSKTVDHALKEDDLDGMLRALMANGRPEFAITFDTNARGHEMFTNAREEMMGSWVLVLLAEDATEIIINPHNVIVSRGRKPRSRYE